MPEKRNVKKEEAAMIWMGPAIAGVVIPGTVYRNGLTPSLEEAVKELPALGKLLAPTVAAVQVRRDLRDPQSAVSICYQKALEYAKKGARE